jgi:hypothetical protein
VTNDTGERAGNASIEQMPHQFMYPKVTPVKPQPTAAKPGAAPAARPAQ